MVRTKGLSNPIGNIFRSIAGVFVGVILILFIASLLLWNAESQNSAKVFSRAVEVSTTSGESGFIRTQGLATTDSKLPCYKGKVEGNCIYFNYVQEELQYETKEHCGTLRSNQELIEEKGEKCRKDSNDEEVCEKCYLVKESNWNVVVRENEFQSFTLGNYKVDSLGKVLGYEQYSKEIDSTHRESMKYIKDESKLLVAGVSDGQTIRDGGKKKFLLFSTKDYESTLTQLKSQDKFVALMLRILTFVCLLVGYGMIFGPISVMSNFVRKVPLIGKFIDGAVDGVIFIASIVLAVVHFILLWVLITILKNIVYIVLFCALLFGIVFLVSKLRK